MKPKDTRSPQCAICGKSVPGMSYAEDETVCSECAPDVPVDPDETAPLHASDRVFQYLASTDTRGWADFEIRELEQHLRDYEVFIATNPLAPRPAHDHA